MTRTTLLFLAGLLAAAAMSTAPAPARAGNPGIEFWEPVIERLVADGFDREDMYKLFSHPNVDYDSSFMGRKVTALFRTRFGGPRPRRQSQFDKPAPGGRPRMLHELHLTPEKHARIMELFASHDETITAAERRYGVSRKVIAAILLIETKLGEYLGEQMAFNSLAGMAATRRFQTVDSYFDGYRVTPYRRRWVEYQLAKKSDWAYKQLKSLIIYARENDLKPLSLPGSIYGAIGLCQFIPTTAMWRGVDGDGDGRVDLFTYPDAVHSIGNFLYNYGWKRARTRRGKLRIILRYNQDIYYARTVLAIADHIGSEEFVAREEPEAGADSPG